MHSATLINILIKQSLDILLVFRTDGKIIEANQAALDAYGYTKSQLLKKSILDIRTEATQSLVSRQIQKVKRKPFRFETVHRRKDGTEFPVESSWSFVEINGEGSILNIVRDISERKAAEELHETDVRMRLANEATGIGNWEWNVVTNQIRWDAEMFQNYGIKPTKDGIVQYEDWRGSVLPDDLLRNEEILQEPILQAGKSRRAFRIRRRNDGEVRHIEAVETVRTNAEGKTEWVVGTDLDVTERKLAEEKLRDGENLVRGTLNSMTSSIAILDRDGVIRDVNEIWKRFAEANGAKMPYHGIGLNYLNVVRRAVTVGDPYAGTILKGLEAVISGQKSEFEYEYPCHAPNEKRWFILKVSPLEQNDGGLVVLHVNITARKQAEDALEENQQFTQSIIDTAPGVIYLFDLNVKRLTYLTPQAAELIGYSFDEIKGEQDSFLQKFMHPDDAPRAQEHFRRLQNTHNGELSEFEYRMRHKSGEWRWFRSRDRVFKRDEKGKPAKILGIAFDITERVRAEAALQAAHSTFRHLVEKSPFGIYAVDADFRVAQVSTGAEKVFENVHPLLNRDFAEVIRIVWPEPFASEVIKLFSHTLETGEPYHAPSTTEQRRDIGVTESYDWKIERVTLPDGRFGVVCHFYDLSERQRYEAELSAARDGLELRVAERTEELAKTNSDLVAEISQRKLAEEQKIAVLRRVAKTQEDERSRIARDLHDQMGQRLTGLRLKIETLKMGVSDNDEISTGLQTLAEIGQTLDDDVGFLIWELRPTIIDELGLAAAVESYLNEWGKRFEISTSFSATGLGDHRLDPEIEINLYRIAQEALNNAAKYAGATNVEVLLQKSGDTTMLIVEDNGAGFDPAKLSTSREAGHGFGLIGMRERTSLISGVFEIESAPGSGTSILVKIPTNNESQISN